MSLSYEALLTELANHIGLPPDDLLTTQELVVDGLTIGLLLEGDETAGDLLYFSVLGTPDAALFPRIARTLLEANYFWVGTGGCTLGVQRDTGAVAITGRIALRDLDGASLAELINGFVDTANFWRAFVNGTPEEESSQAAQPPGFEFQMRA